MNKYFFNNSKEAHHFPLLGGLRGASHFHLSGGLRGALRGASHFPKKSRPPLAVGSHYQGGIIAYMDGNGHGLIAAPSDHSDAIHWHSLNDIATGAQRSDYGTGKSNTMIIVAMQGAGSYAAQLCFDLALNDYRDWFLPSKDELNMLYQNSDLIGGFSTGHYWSSTDYGVSLAWSQDFSTGTHIYSNKNLTCRVRPVRYF